MDFISKYFNLKDLNIKSCFSYLNNFLEYLDTKKMSKIKEEFEEFDFEVNFRYF